MQGRGRGYTRVFVHLTCLKRLLAFCQALTVMKAVHNPTTVTHPSGKIKMAATTSTECLAYVADVGPTLSQRLLVVGTFKTPSFRRKRGESQWRAKVEDLDRCPDLWRFGVWDILTVSWRDGQFYCGEPPFGCASLVMADFLSRGLGMLRNITYFNWVAFKLGIYTMLKKPNKNVYV